MFTFLGENVPGADEAARVVREYETLMEEASSADLEPQVSVKPTQLGLDVDEALVLGALHRLQSKARDLGGFVWIDMEDSSYRRKTIRIFRAAMGHAGPGPTTQPPEAGSLVRTGRVGLCLQAYLRSTPEDLDDLLPLRPAIRLVKGAYAEKPDVALPEKADVDRAFFRSAVRVLGTPGAWLGLATHDPALIGRLRTWIEENAIPRDRYEFQMLYGIRREARKRMTEEGEPVRVLISYGPEWFPWYMRRLAERPANLGFVLRSLFHG